MENAIVVRGNEILNDDGLRNRHEFVNHKILDCFGDLMLSGHRILGHIKTSQGGHALTNKLLLNFYQMNQIGPWKAKKILKQEVKWKNPKKNY